MTKIRKQKRRKKFQYNVNRKRLNKKSLGGPKGEVIKNEWKVFSSTQKNFLKNGLVYDVNADIRKLNKNDSEEKVKKLNENVQTTGIVAQLEEAASEVEKKQCNMSKDQMDYLGYLVNKYGDNYKDMAKDKRNYLQHTWRQLKHKIKTYKIVLDRQERLIKKKEGHNPELKVNQIP